MATPVRLPTAATRSDTSGEGRLALGVAAAFAAATLARVFVHEPWRDELASWAATRDATSLGDLFERIRTNGHPYLWNLVEFAASRLTRDISIQQVVHVAVASAAIWVLTRYAPFPRVVRLLCAGGYYFSFEYAVIARNYALGLLLTFAACALASRRPRPLVAFGLVLALLAETSVFGLIVGWSIAAGVALDERLRWRSGNRSAGASGLVAAVSLLAGTALSLFQMAGGENARYLPSWRTSIEGDALERIVGHAADAFLPVPRFTGSFWNTHLLDTAPGAKALLGGALLVAVGLAVARFRRPAALAVWGVGTAGVLLFEYVRYEGYHRHHGHLLVVAIAAAWLASSFASTGPPREVLRFGPTVYAFLALHVAVAVGFSVTDVARPWSGSAEAATLLREAGLENEPLAGDTDTAAAAVAALLDRPMWYPMSGRRDDYVVFDNRRLLLSEPELVARVDAFRAEERRDIVLVRNAPLLQPPPYYRLVAVADDSIVADERFWLYLVGNP